MSQQKIVVTASAVIGVVLLLLVSLIGLYFWQPVVTWGSDPAEKVVLGSWEVNQEEAYPKLSFNELHQITFQATGESVIVQEYQITAEDLVEGENIIVVSKVTDLGLGKLASEEVDEYTLAVDRVAPEFNLESELPSAIHLQKTFKVQARGEVRAKMMLNDQELGEFTGEESQEFQVSVVDGQHTWRLWSQDSFGNASETVEQEVFALQKDNWEAYECGGVRLGYDKTRFQRGYAGMHESSAEKNSPDALNHLATTQTGVCDFNTEGFSGLIINPKGEKLYCSACGGELNLRYVMLGKEYHQDEGLHWEIDRNKQYIIKDEEYTNKFGVRGRLLYLDLPTQEFLTHTQGPRQLHFFLFQHQNHKLYIRTEHVRDGAEKDFMSIVDNFTVIDK